jgi:alcohol dehydrogenase, propanol-preferring
MHACLLHHQAPIESKPLLYTQLPDPTPAPSEVLVRVRACAVCRTDLHIVEGDLRLRKSPIIPGHQIVGTIECLGPAVTRPDLNQGDRVGIAWLQHTCGHCRFCTSSRENLCDTPDFTGWTRDGGYAELCTTPADFVYKLPDTLDDLHAAPLLCAGIIGFRALRLGGPPLRGGSSSRWHNFKLGIYGFGAAGHIAIQLARARGADVYFCTRDAVRHQALARELGATWVGSTSEAPPAKLDAAIIFAPAGELIPSALAALDKGGSLVLGGIHMSPTPPLDYSLLYHERIIRSVANNTRQDGLEFLAESASLPLRTSIRTFPLAQANDALLALKTDAIKGAAVLVP